MLENVAVFPVALEVTHATKLILKISVLRHHARTATDNPEAEILKRLDHQTELLSLLVSTLRLHLSENSAEPRPLCCCHKEASLGDAEAEGRRQDLDRGWIHKL